MVVCIVDFSGSYVAYLVNRYSEDIYQANCSVIIANENTPRGDIESVIEDMTNIRNRRTKAVVQNEITVLKSYKMAHAALENLDFKLPIQQLDEEALPNPNYIKVLLLLLFRILQNPISLIIRLLLPFFLQPPTG